MKGTEQGSHLRVSQIITEVTGVSAGRIAALSPDPSRRPSAASLAAALHEDPER